MKSQRTNRTPNLILLPGLCQAEKPRVERSLFLRLLDLERESSKKGPLSLRTAARAIGRSPRRTLDALRSLIALGAARRVLIETGGTSRVHRYEFSSSRDFLPGVRRRILTKEQTMRMVSPKRSPGRPKKEAKTARKPREQVGQKKASKEDVSGSPSPLPLQPHPPNPSRTFVNERERSEANASDAIAPCVASASAPSFDFLEECDGLSEKERELLEREDRKRTAPRRRSIPNGTWELGNWLSRERERRGIEIMLEPKGKFFGTLKRIRANFDEEKARKEMESVGIETTDPLRTLLEWGLSRPEWAYDFGSVGRLEFSLNQIWARYFALVIRTRRDKVEIERDAARRKKEREEEMKAAIEELRERKARA